MIGLDIVKNRPLAIGQRVFVYYNLHKGGYSIRDKATGLVVAYAKTVLLKGVCTFKVSESGRLKTVKERRKRVHAGVEGDFHGASLQMDLAHFSKVYYNPYLVKQFMLIDQQMPISEAGLVYFINKVCYVGGNGDRQRSLF